MTKKTKETKVTEDQITRLEADVQEARRYARSMFFITGITLLAVFVLGMFMLGQLFEASDIIDDYGVMTQSVAQNKQDINATIRWAEGFQNAVFVTLYQAGIVDEDGAVVDPVFELDLSS